MSKCKSTSEKKRMTDDEIIALIEKYDTTNKLTWTNETCLSCDRKLNSWDIRICKALLITPHECESCIAEKEYAMTVDALRSRMLEKFGMEPCKGI